VSAWEPAGEPELVGGILAQPYTFDEEGMGAAGETEAQEQAWLATEGDYVAQFHLVLQVEPSASGLNAEGTYTIDYGAAPIEASIDAVLPSDCRLPLPEMQHLGPASDMINLPGYLEFVVQATVSEAVAYYQQVIDQSGWALVGEPEIGETRAWLTFAAPGQSVDLNIDGGDSTTVSLIGHRSAGGTGAPSEGGQTGGGAEPTAVPSTVDPAVRVLDAFNLLVDTDGEPVLASYHLEVEHQAPVWAGTAVGSVSSTLIADVQGADVHFTDQTSGGDGSSSTTEVYIIDDQEYVMQGGVPVQGFGMAALTWAMWPLDPLSILSAGATGATLEGTETIEGRPAEVYSIGGSGMPLPSIGGIGSLGIPVTAAEGTVWVDQATGVLVGAVIDYESDVKDDGGTVRGQGAGHLEIHVTGIDATSVALPR
jgi:hypothetical protein